jgi:hypothetical protein
MRTAMDLMQVFFEGLERGVVKRKRPGLDRPELVA